MAIDRDKIYVTTFSVRKELKEPLREGLGKIGLESYGDLANLVARHGDEMALALGPIVEKYLHDKRSQRSQPAVKRGKGKVTLAVESALTGASAKEIYDVLDALGLRGKTP